VLDGVARRRADPLGGGPRVGEQARALGFGALLRAGADLGELALEVDELALPLRIALARRRSSAAASSRSLRIACGARRRRSGSACA
jgi:hypothetical protein